MKVAPAKKFAREAGFFFVANLIAGLLNYLYQICASKYLDRSLFADVSAWIAYVSMFLMIAGILQYAGNFFPANKASLRRQILFINAAVLIVLVATLSTVGFDPWIVGALIVVVGLATGWLTGQAQFRLFFNLLGAISILTGTFKLMFVFVPMFHLELIERFYSAVLVSALPSLWIMSYYLWNSDIPSVKNSKGRHLWMAPIILSVASALIPQFDLVVLRRTLSPDMFAEFARTSLFYKGVFFLFMIGAQWLLPRQIQSTDKPGHPALTSIWLLPLSFLGSVFMTVAAKPLAIYILGWDAPPALDIVFLSCLNMCLLTWLYLLIQENCAKGKTTGAALGLIGLGILAGLQMGIGFPIHTYLGMGLVLQALAVYGLVINLKQRDH